jgi:uncharacterized protein
MNQHMAPRAAASPDIQATIARLFVYPVKSCAGIEVKEAVLLDTGLDLDRAWMVVDAKGDFVSQRELPRMALIKPQLKTQELVLRAPGMLALHVRIDAVEGPATVTVWDDTVAAFDMGDIAAQWFTDFLSLTPAGLPGTDAQKYRMVRFDPDCRRLSSKKWTQGVDAATQFADGYALLVTGTASMDVLNERLAKAGHAAVGVERFRPNIVLAGLEAHDEDRLGVLHIAVGGGAGSPVTIKPVKPCTRCSIPNIDPLTAHSTSEVNDTLQAYRANALMEGAITFGMNAIVLSGADSVLRLGQKVSGNFDFV